MSAFPNGWQEAARTTGAIKHALKDFASEADLLRVLLLHIGKGYSLRETAVVAKAAGLADVSDVAILKRLRKSEEWFLFLCRKLFLESGVDTPSLKKDINIRLVDGSVIAEPGKTGSQWRLHYSLRIPDLSCDFFKICSAKGELTGESFTQYPLKKNDHIIGDRGYSTPRGISYVHSRHARVLVRVNTAALPLYDSKGDAFSLLKAVKTVTAPLEAKEWDVCVSEEKDVFIQGRLIVLRKSEDKIEEAVKKIKATAAKKGRTIKPQTLEFAKYVILFTTFSRENFTTHDVLEHYRLRWQIELIFKRFKSILQLGHLPKFDPQSSRSWLYGKLFLALLTEKLARISRAFSPWGYRLQESVA